MAILCNLLFLIYYIYIRIVSPSLCLPSDRRKVNFKAVTIVLDMQPTVFMSQAKNHFIIIINDACSLVLDIGHSHLLLLTSNSCQPSCASRHPSWPVSVLH